MPILNLVSTTNDEIRDRVETFVKDLERLIRKQALESVASALGASTGGGGGGRSKAPARAAARPAVESFGGSRKRRTAKEIDSLAASILEYVEKNPGQRSEKIKAALRIPAPDWNLPVKKLIEENKISTKGEKRATEYFAKKK